jgi:hypothetical protein
VVLPFLNDCSPFVLEEMGIFNVARLVDQVLKRKKNYVTECHGRVVDTPVLH